MGAGAALAFWGSTDSSNPARAAADALQAGSAPTGSATNQNVTVTWTVGSTVGGRAATGYSVHRYASPSGGTAVPATGGCAGTIVALTCTEAGIPAGLWYYTITPGLSLWVGVESARTAVSVNQAPTITTGAGVTFTVGAAASFTVSTTGFPAATISETGTLPSGVTLTNNGNGTATLGGTAGPNTGGTYPLTITAANGTLPNATQSFTLTVDQAPAITSASGVTFTVGTAGTFTVQTTGFPTPPTITRSGTLPGGVTFVNNGNGTATLSGSPGTSGVFALTMTASNGVAPNATQNFTLTVGINHLLLGAATTTPVAGTPDNLTITALDGANNVLTTYAGSKNLVFAGATPTGTFSPSVVNGAGVTTTFGATTAINFTNGVATVSAGRNGVMTLYKAEAATITVSDGTINNGTGLPVTVSPAAGRLAWTAVSNQTGTVSPPCSFTCTYTGVGGGGTTFKAKIALMDQYGNPIAAPAGGVSVLVTKSGGTFTGSATVTIPAGSSTSSTGGDGTVPGEITFTSRSGSWSTDTLTATPTPSVAAAATASFTK
jgi:hypothetical protein